MRFIIITFLLFSYFRPLAQNSNQELKGKITYKNTQSVYVRFDRTMGISQGDTLHLSNGDSLVPALVVNHLSSISCVTTPLEGVQVEVGQEVYYQLVSREPVSEAIEAPEPDLNMAITEPDNDLDRERLRERSSDLRGKVAVGSYTNFSSNHSTSTQRMRYTFSLDANHLANSDFSFESYAIFRHSANEWSEVKQNLASALKIYSLALTYEPNDRTEMSLGRKINRNMSNVGAIDGLQISRKIQNFIIGGILGSRPDSYDYGLNLHQLQYGGFVSYDKKYDNLGYLQTSLAAIEQKYYSKTDRRFIYLQHSNSLIHNLNIFSSIELDLLKIKGDQLTNAVSPTSIFLSLHYRASRKLSISSSYDARRNVIYYESFRSTIDRLIEQETRQGARLRVNYRPFKYITIGTSGGYRFQRDQQNTSKNLYGFLSVSRIPWIGASATLSSTFLESNYLKGNIYGIMFSKDLVGGNMQTELNYRKVKYRYSQFSSQLNQDIFTMSLSGRITKKLSISTNCEATLEKGRTLYRIYSNLIQRF